VKDRTVTNSRPQRFQRPIRTVGSANGHDNASPLAKVDCRARYENVRVATRGYVAA
jgi:hypothetical protein